MLLKPFLIKIDDLIFLQSVGHVKVFKTFRRRSFDEFMEYLEEVYIHKLICGFGMLMENIWPRINLICLQII